MRIFLGVLIGSALAWAAPAPPSATDKVSGLIKQLGASDAREREAAHKALEEIGAPAIEPLRKAALAGDTEFAKRAMALAEKIRLLTDTSAIFGPTMIDVNIKDMPLPDAIAALAKASGIPVRVQDAEKLKERKITLPAGKIAFWTAIDEVCKQGKVTIADGLNIRDTGGIAPVRPLPGVIRPLPAPIRPAVIRPAPAPKEADPKDKPKDEKPDDAKKPGDEKPKDDPKPAPKPAPKAVAPAFQPAPKIGGFPAPPARPVTGKEVVIADQEPNFPTTVMGPFLIRAIPNSQLPTTQRQLYHFGLQIFSEPKLARFTVGEVKVTTLVDDNDQTREFAPLPARGVAKRDTGVRATSMMRPGAPPVASYPFTLKDVPKEAKSLKEFSGVLPIQVQTIPRELLSITDLSKTKTATSALGITLELKEFTKNADGTYTIQAELTYRAGIMPDTSLDPEIIANPIGAGAGRAVTFTSGLRLADKDGALLIPTQMQTQSQQIDVAPLLGPLVGGGLLNEERTRLMTVTHMRVTGTFASPVRNELTPANLYFRGMQTKNVEVPFTLKNLPLK